VELLESLERFVVVAKTLVNEAQVVNGLNAISLNANSLKEKLLGSVIVFIDEETVAFVDECLGVVSVVLNSQISKRLSRLKIVLEEVEERNVVRS
jgi:hypothetical protein